MLTASALKMPLSAMSVSQRFENATERYVRLLKSKPEIILRAPMVHVASFLQMTPETLSRVRSSHVD